MDGMFCVRYLHFIPVQLSGIVGNRYAITDFHISHLTIRFPHLINLFKCFHTLYPLFLLSGGMQKSLIGFKPFFPCSKSSKFHCLLVYSTPSSHHSLSPLASSTAGPSSL